MHAPTLTAHRAPEHHLTLDPYESSPRTLIVVMAFSCLVVALQQTLVVPVVPQLPSLLGAAPSTTSWVVTATLLAGALSTPIVSRLADIVGKRRMLVLSVAFVIVGSIIAPLGGITSVIVGRALQGLGTALVPVGMAVMRDELPQKKLGSSLALLSATLGIGGGVGIPLGGAIIGALSWQWLFWISAILSTVSLLLIIVFVPSRRSGATASFDVIGAVWMSAALTMVLLAISKGGAWGYTSSLTLVLFLGGLALLAAWVFFELRTPHALVDIRTAAARPVLLTHLASLVMGFAMFTNLLVTTMQLQGSPMHGGFDQSAAVAGAAMLPSALVMFVVPAMTSALERRVGAAWALGIGAIIALAAYALRPFLSFDAFMVIGWTTVASAGIAICYAALPLLLVLNVPRHETAAANGLNALLRAVGTAISSAFVAGVGSQWAATVGDQMEPTLTALWIIFAGGAAACIATIAFAAAIPAKEIKQ